MVFQIQQFLPEKAPARYYCQQVLIKTGNPKHFMARLKYQAIQNSSLFLTQNRFIHPALLF